MNRHYPTYSGYSTLITTYNSGRCIRECLSSLKKYGPANNQIIVIDNASTDNTVQEIEKELDGITFIKNTKNIGLGAATCQAYELATGEMILFSNPDITYTEKSRKLFEYADSHPDIGMMQPPLKQNVLGSYGGPQPGYKRNPFWLAFYFGSALNKKFRNFLVNYYVRYGTNKFPKSISVKQEGDTQSYGASCMLFTRWFVNMIGGIFRPQYFWVFGDSDMSRRITVLGLHSTTVPESEVEHFGGSTTQGKKPTDREVELRHLLSAYCWGNFEKDWGHWTSLFLLFFLDSIFLVASQPLKEKKKPTRGMVHRMRLVIMARIYHLKGWLMVLNR